jgi:hypothetical protein
VPGNQLPVSLQPTSPMEFPITFKGDIDPKRTVARYKNKSSQF